MRLAVPTGVPDRVDPGINDRTRPARHIADGAVHSPGTQDVCRPAYRWILAPRRHSLARALRTRFAGAIAALVDRDLGVAPVHGHRHGRKRPLAEEAAGPRRVIYKTSWPVVDARFAAPSAGSGLSRSGCH